MNKVYQITIKPVYAQNKLKNWMKYRAIFTSPDHYFKSRLWCFSRLGPSIEYERWSEVNRNSIDTDYPNWVWDSRKVNHTYFNHLYFRDEYALSMFKTFVELNLDSVEIIEFNK